MCNTYCFPMATMVSQKFLNITFIWTALPISFLIVFDNFSRYKCLFADVRSCNQIHIYFFAKFLKLGKLTWSMMGGNLVISCPLGCEEIRSKCFFFCFKFYFNSVILYDMLSYDFRSDPNISYCNASSEDIFKDCRDLPPNPKVKNNSASHSLLNS
jgi:hypothetical protein